MFGKDKDKIKRQELMRLAIEAKTPEEKERIRAERMAHSKQTSESIDLEYVAASLKAAGSALTPLGAITGWGQGDLKRLNAEKRQKEQMDALLADRELVDRRAGGQRVGGQRVRAAGEGGRHDWNLLSVQVGLR